MFAFCIFDCACPAVQHTDTHTPSSCSDPSWPTCRRHRNRLTGERTFRRKVVLQLALYSSSYREPSPLIVRGQLHCSNFKVCTTRWLVHCGSQVFTLEPRKWNWKYIRFKFFWDLLKTFTNILIIFWKSRIQYSTMGGITKTKVFCCIATFTFTPVRWFSS